MPAEARIPARDAYNPGFSLPAPHADNRSGFEMPQRRRPSRKDAIDGVKVNEVRNVQKGQGQLTEIFRADWGLDDGVVEQVFEVWLGPRRS